MSFPPLLNCWYLTGPTASGKTAVGVELAERIGADIISLDSMAVYRGMDIGTAKPTAAQRRRVAHHLVDVVDPWEDFSLARYVESAHAAAADVRQRGREVLLVGGTPLYLKAMLRGLFQGPPADWPLRHKLQEEASRLGSAVLHERLAGVDPAAAARLHPNDARRIIRALEVYEQTGRPISQWQRQFDAARPADECRVFALDRPRAQLYRAIDARVEAMFAAGLVDEVRALLSGGRALSRTAAQALGYREVLEHLASVRDLPATIECVQRRTRQFAKRQLTWLRSLSECRFVPLEESPTAAEVAQSTAKLAGTPP